jgi:hypothetical protein
VACSASELSSWEDREARQAPRCPLLTPLCWGHVAKLGSDVYGQQDCYGARHEGPNSWAVTVSIPACFPVSRYLQPEWYQCTWSDVLYQLDLVRATRQLDLVSIYWKQLSPHLLAYAGWNRHYQLCFPEQDHALDQLAMPDSPSCAPTLVNLSVRCGTCTDVTSVCRRNDVT